MGTMLGIQSSLNGAAGALAPPLGGFLYREILSSVLVTLHGQVVQVSHTATLRVEYVLSILVHLGGLRTDRLGKIFDMSSDHLDLIWVTDPNNQRH